MVTGKTKSGFNFKIEDDALDNYDLLEVLMEIDEGNSLKMTKAAKMLLGAEQHDALKKHCEVGGKVIATKMFTEISEILNYNEIKN